jgi:hypothetical protein
MTAGGWIRLGAAVLAACAGTAATVVAILLVHGVLS